MPNCYNKEWSYGFVLTVHSSTRAWSLISCVGEAAEAMGADAHGHLEYVSQSTMARNLHVQWLEFQHSSASDNINAAYR